MAAVYTHDSRRAEADRAFATHVQRGAPPAVVAALLPALVGPSRAQRAAEAFLARHGYVGHDISPQGEAVDRVLLGQAKALQQSLLESGAFAGTGEPVYVVNPARYALSEKQASEALSEAGYTWHDASARHNANVIAASDAEPELVKKHGGPVTIDIETGKVYQWRNGKTQVDQIALPGDRHLSDVSHLQRGQYEDANLSNPEADDGTGDWGYGPDRPFFVGN